LQQDEQYFERTSCDDAGTAAFKVCWLDAIDFDSLLFHPLHEFGMLGIEWKSAGSVLVVHDELLHAWVTLETIQRWNSG